MAHNPWEANSHLANKIPCTAEDNKSDCAAAVFMH